MFRVESAGPQDMAGVYRTCLLTGDAGRDASDLLRDPDLMGHVYAGPYVMRGLGTQLVVLDEAGSAGYLFSADDTLAFESWAARHWWPALVARYPLRPGEAGLDARLVGLIHRPSATDPELARVFPAHLHIDLQERAQGHGLGRVLIERLLKELRERHVGGVHAGVDGRNEAAIGFYRHLGFVDVVDRPWGIVMGLRLGD